jgi:outer membrane receptor protein involved in Fe transport
MKVHGFHREAFPMRMTRSKIRFLSAVLLLTAIGTAMAGTTGKIAGRVTDRATGEPLMGVNVMVEGTELGAVTDAAGNYTVLQVPPGTFALNLSLLGYAKTRVSDIRVLIDQTAAVSVPLAGETIAGTAVSIVAERKAVKKDVATSVASVSSKELETLPYNSVSEVVGLQAGVEQGLVIRGGGAGQALFQLDGVTLRDPRNNQPISNVSLSAIQEISIERGGFNAEYGQVRSGIVNVVTKEGDRKRYSGSLTLKAAPPAKKYMGSSPFDANAMMLRPYLDPDVCWTGTQSGAWNLYVQRQYPQFEGWNSISRSLMTDGDPNNDLSPAAAQQLFRWQHRRQEINNQADTDIDAGFGGPVPLIGRSLGNLRFFASYRGTRDMLLVPLSRPDTRDSNFSLKLNADVSPTIKLTVLGVGGRSFYTAQNEAGLDANAQYIVTPEQVAAQIANPDISRATDSRLFCDSYFSTARVDFTNLSVKMTHVLGPHTFYEIGVERMDRRYRTGPIGLRDFTRSVEYAPGKFTDESPFGFDPLPDNGIGGMMTGGHTSTVRDQSRLSTTTVKFDLNSQVNFQNLVKTGFEFSAGNLHFDYGDVKEAYVEGNTYVRMHKVPLQGAFYLQDKLELEGLVVNAGLRLDYNDANTQWPDVGTWDKDFYSSNYIEGSAFPSRRSKPRLALSPRVGISHPITENAKLFFNYGHFQQMPTYEQMYRLSRSGSHDVRGIGDPGLVPEKTVAYEIGFDQSIAEACLVQVAAFYHDISKERDYTQYISADGSMNYFKATNNLYEDVQGLEVTVKKASAGWWTGFLNFTYQVSNAGHFLWARVYQDPKAQRDFDRDTRAMYQERPIPQPFARGMVSFFSPRSFGPGFFGMRPLGDWNLNLIADWRAGQWVTWNPGQKLNVSQNVKSKDWFNLQLRLAKTVSFDRLHFTFFVDMDNALDARRLSMAGFYDSHDYDFYFQSLHLPRSDAYGNIPGKDKAGDYRKPGVDYQPVEQVGSVASIAPASARPEAIYYEISTGKYMNLAEGAWAEVGSARMKKILDDKAYIDMPNHSYFNFLDPRRIFFCVKTTFDL